MKTKKKGKTASHERKKFPGFLCMDLDLGGMKCYDEMNNDIETTKDKVKQSTRTTAMKWRSQRSSER